MILRSACSFVLAGGALYAIAQPTLTASTSVPTVPADVTVFTANNNLGASSPGADVVHDYWNMLVPNTGTRNYYYRAANTTPTAASIPTATLLSTDGGADTLFWAVTSQGLEQVGAKTDLEGVVSFSDPYLELKLPCTYGTAWSDAIGASYVVSGVVPVTRVGTITGLADAYGSLTMPNVVVLTNVLRVKIRRDITDNSALANVHRISNIYHYYSTNFAHPMLTLVEDSVQIGTGAWAVAKSAQWQGDGFIVGVDEMASAESAFSAYPNPVADRLTVALPDGAHNATRIQVIDAAGRSIIEQRSSGNTAQLTVSSLQPGVYSVRVFDGERLLGVRRVTVL